MTMSDAKRRSLISKLIGPKKRWRAYRARVRRLPQNYRTTVDAIERYTHHFVPTDGDSAMSQFEDLADLFERAAADNTPIRAIVGDDPIEFVETFVANYTKGGYVPDQQRDRLITAIDRAAANDVSRGSGR
jgi:DNA-binding ferritin-like protein (Dps family)